MIDPYTPLAIVWVVKPGMTMSLVPGKTISSGMLKNGRVAELCGIPRIVPFPFQSLKNALPWIVALVFIVRWSATTGPETVAPRMTTVPLLPTAPLLTVAPPRILMLRSAMSLY